MLKRFVIERELKGIGAASEANLGDAAQNSNGALAKIDGVQWEHSYVTADKTFCIYLAESSELIREHAKVAGLPGPATHRFRTLPVRARFVLEFVPPGSPRRRACAVG